MLWWIPIAAAGMACLGVLTVVASTAAGRYEGQHVLTDPQEEWDAWSAEQGYGSMDVTAEQALHHELPWLPAPTVDPEPWRAQMTAELSPEALDDSGPGATSSLVAALGPVPAPTRDDDQGRAVRVRADESRPAARADLTGSLSSRPHEEDPGSLARGEPGPSRWLAEQLDILRAWSERQQAYAEILA